MKFRIIMAIILVAVAGVLYLATTPGTEAPAGSVPQSTTNDNDLKGLKIN